MYESSDNTTSTHGSNHAILTASDFSWELDGPRILVSHFSYLATSGLMSTSCFFPKCLFSRQIFVFIACIRNTASSDMTGTTWILWHFFTKRSVCNDRNTLAQHSYEPLLSSTGATLTIRFLQCKDKKLSDISYTVHIHIHTDHISALNTQVHFNPGVSHNAALKHAWEITVLF